MSNLPHSAPPLSKAQLRQRVLAMREKISPEDRQRAMVRILPQLVAIPSYRSARKVAAYMSFGSEIDTGPFIETVLADQKSLVLPRVDSATHTLSLHNVFDRDRLLTGPWGIREPAADWPRADIQDIDFLLVPGVAFDRHGQRIGYGAGFYDRLLSRRARPIECVAIAFDCQVLDRVPAESHDQPIDRLITETLNDEFYT